MELTFLTFNIHKGIGNDRLFRLNRTIEVLEASGADLIMLQEVDHHVPRSRNQDTAKVIAETLGFYYSIGLNVKLKTGAYGNATFSRFPILKTRNMDLTWGIKKARGCLINSIETPAGEVLAINYHLGLAGVERIWQTKKIIHSVHTKHNRELPAIISGDSNDRNHKLNPLFDAAGFKDTCQVMKMFTYPAYAPIWRLDKVFVNNKISVREHSVVRNNLTRVASDHLPISVRLKINP